EETHGVGHGGAALADLNGDGIGREPELVAEPLEGARRLDGVEVLALEVLDERGLEGRLVAELADEDGHLEEARLLRGAPAALAESLRGSRARLGASKGPAFCAARERRSPAMIS